MPPGTSLVKFMNQRDGNGRGQLHWHRAGLDGLPFRGTIPNYTEEEFEEKLVKTGDPRNGIFDVSDAEQNKAYMAVQDKIVNGWAQAVFVERRYDEENKTWLVYIEWVEYFMEDSSPAQVGRPLLE